MEETEFFIFDVQDNHGLKTRVWAFGIEDIMPEPEPDPVDLQSIRHPFPHVSDKAFESPRRRK